VPGKVNELTISTASLIDTECRHLVGEVIAEVRGMVVTIR
jgi:hypothetical protein